MLIQKIAGLLLMAAIFALIVVISACEQAFAAANFGHKIRALAIVAMAAAVVG